MQFNKYIHTYIHTYIHEDQREWHRMTRMTRPDCAVMCNLINIHTYIHTHIHTYMHTYIHRRTRASKLAHERGGITKAANALISPPAAPRDSRTLATLRGKHPTEDPAAIAIGKAQAERRAGIAAVGEQEQQPRT